MPRELPIGNGNLLINFDANYNLRDIYYPHVGADNHTGGSICHTGLWVDGRFAWIDAAQWRKRLAYEADTLVTEVQAVSDELRLTLTFHDVVDFNRDIFLRQVDINNWADAPREVRLFFHYDLRIWGSAVGDTIYYHPYMKALVAYKNKRYFAASGKVSDRVGIDSWATGIKGLAYAEGTWRDAEDGKLERNPIAQGSVDGTIAFHPPPVPAGGTVTIYHWLIVATGYQEATQLDSLVRERGPESFIHRTRHYWRLWVNKDKFDFADLSPSLVALYKRSLLILRTQIDNRGAIIAGNDSDVALEARDTYSYMWPRDGALVAMALDKAGHSGLTQQFFRFCGGIISPEGFFFHKYTPFGSLGSSWHPWIDEQGNVQLPIQEDETALVLYALWKHFAIYTDIELIRSLYRRLVKNAAEFMINYREPNTRLPAPSYDLWEERRGILSFTVAAVWAGLQAAANFTAAFGDGELAEHCRRAAAEIHAATAQYLYDEKEGRFLRMINIQPDGSIQRDYTLDSSLCGLFQFEMFSAADPRIERTVAAIRERLWCRTPVGGLARYEGDYFHRVSHDYDRVPGNPWFVCTLWLAGYYIARARSLEELKPAVEILEWVSAHALPSGVLAEQVNPYTNEPLSVAPLTWSHATLVGTIQDYLAKRRALSTVPTIASSLGHVEAEL